MRLNLAWIGRCAAIGAAACAVGPQYAAAQEVDARIGPLPVCACNTQPNVLHLVLHADGTLSEGDGSAGESARMSLRAAVARRTLVGGEHPNLVTSLRVDGDVPWELVVGTLVALDDNPRVMVLNGPPPSDPAWAHLDLSDVRSGPALFWATLGGSQ